MVRMRIARGGRRRVGDDRARGLDAVHHRHADVHEHDVGRQFARERDRLGAVGGLAHDLEVGRRVDEHAEAAAHERLVVGDEHADRRVAHVMTRSSRRVAAARRRGSRRPAAAPASNVPPSAATRSRMPARPWPARRGAVAGDAAVVGDLDDERVALAPDA